MANQIVLITNLEVYVVDPMGEVQEYQIIPNSFGGAMSIWLNLAKKYRIPLDFLHPESSFTHLWASIGLMEKTDQWVMAMTFDRFIVPKAHLQTLTHHLQQFQRTVGSTKTLQTLYTTLKRALKDEAVQGICFNQTSVCDPFWRIQTENDEERAYNIHRDSGHTFLTPNYLERRTRGED